MPVHKTGTAFTKPVDPLLGQAIEAWQAVRPAQPAMIDRKTSEHVNMLFAVRGQPVARSYINHRSSPDCRQGRRSRQRSAGPDHQPPCLCHHCQPSQRQGTNDIVRAAGLARPSQTKHHPALREDHPKTLSKAAPRPATSPATRTIEVLLDRDAVASGTAATGQPWQHYDLGHGLCSYTFF